MNAASLLSKADFTTFSSSSSTSEKNVHKQEEEEREIINAIITNGAAPASHNYTNHWNKKQQPPPPHHVTEVMGISCWPPLSHSPRTSSSVQDQVQESTAVMKHVTDARCSADGCEKSVSSTEVSKSSIFSCNNDATSKIKMTLSISIENGVHSETQKQNGSDSASRSSQQPSSTNRLRQKSRPYQNRIHYSGFQNLRNSNWRHPPRFEDESNSNRGYNNAGQVNWQNHMPGYPCTPVGFNGPPNAPRYPYPYPNFTSINNPLPHFNVPFQPIPYSFPPPTQYSSYMAVGYFDVPYISGGASFSPQTSQSNNLQDPDVSLCYYAIRRQIEYYFSEENLATDYFLRNNMDAYGWVSVDLIATFNKVRRMTRDVDLILRGLIPSQIVEVQGNNIRKRENWKTWILPKHSQEDMLLNKFQNIQLDARPEI